jgi:hypothetical protein
LDEELERGLTDSDREMIAKLRSSGRA